MNRLTVDFRAFRENPAMYLLKSDAPIAITMHGNTIGHYTPSRRRRTEAEIAALDEAAARLHEILSGFAQPNTVMHSRTPRNHEVHA